MNFTEEHIWAYLDGSLDLQLVQPFLNAMEQSPDLKKQYDEAYALHASMRKMTPRKAPKNMLLNIMKQIQPRKSYVKAYASFGGLFKALAISAGVIALICFLIYLGASNTTTPPSDGTIANFMVATKDALTPQLEISKYAPYSLVIVCALILFYLDNMLKKRFAKAVKV